MAVSRRALVDVFPSSSLEERTRLFSALQAAFAVTFRPYSADRDRADEESDRADGFIALATGSQIRLPAELADGRRPVLAVSGCADRGGGRERVQLLDDPGLDRRLHGIVLEDRLVSPLEPIEEQATVLASARSGPAWTVSAGGAPVHRVRSVLAELEPDQVLWSMLSQRPIATVALIQFLRSISGAPGWDPPPLRATFMFDDPNLHWRSYGFIDYRRLLIHAETHGYHAAMAMVPLDGGRAHRPTAALFARRPDRLSLLVHGNDHVRQELQALREPCRAVAVAAQASRRMARFERRAGVTVDRVMTPPHGLCSREMTRALGAVGFDALCAEHPLPWTERLPPESVLAAWRPAEFVGGSAVIPRMPLRSSAASIALRAFLDHPLVIYGHHGDLAEGLDQLATIAATVNRLGDVRWLSMGEIASSNLDLRVDGVQAVVRPLSRRIRLALPEHVRALRVAEPHDLLGEGQLSGWSFARGPLIPFGEAVPTPGREQICIWLRGHGDVDPLRVVDPAWRPWPKLRRIVVESRDRALPALRWAAVER